MFFLFSELGLCLEIAVGVSIRLTPTQIFRGGIAFYCIESFPKIIRKANFDGSDVEEVISLQLSVPYALELIEGTIVSTDQPVVKEKLEINFFPNPTNGRIDIRGATDEIDLIWVIDSAG